MGTAVDCAKTDVELPINSIKGMIDTIKNLPKLFSIEICS
jgi:hypothetical protein